MNRLETITDQRIPGLLSRNGTSVVLLSSAWDGNGIIMKAIIEGLAEGYGQIGFYQADYDDSPRLARLFNVLTPPGILFIRDGELLHRVTKPMSAGGIRDIIQSIAS